MTMKHRDAVFLSNNYLRNFIFAFPVRVPPLLKHLLCFEMVKIHSYAFFCAGVAK